MINRELIRTKIVQLTYAYYQNGDRHIDKAEQELLFSLSKAYHLYHHLMALIVAVLREARRRHGEECARAAAEGAPVPSDRFICNAFALQLESNRQLCEVEEGLNHTWDEDFVKRLHDLVTQSATYREYMAEDGTSYEADRELWRKLYKDLIMENDDLDALLEEKSLYWNDDKGVVDTFVIKTIKRFDPANGDRQELLPEYKDEEDRNFATRLFRASILNADRYRRLMGEASRNWDFSRMALMDVVIMQIALAEMTTFPNIPVSVTINEYVNLARTYSTPRSASYINGMLDTIARHLIEEGSLLKSMPRPAAGPGEGE